MTTNNEFGLRERDVLAMCDINASSKTHLGELRLTTNHMRCTQRLEVWQSRV